MSISLKGRVSSFKGKHHTEEAKQKSREANLGRNKGKSWEEIYGVEKAEERRENLILKNRRSKGKKRGKYLTGV